MCGQVCVRESLLYAGPSVCRWRHSPSCGYNTQSRHLLRAHTRGAWSVGVRVRGGVYRQGLRALPPPRASQTSAPTRSLPSCQWLTLGGSEGGGSQRGDGLMGGHASVTYRGAWGPWRPREPSRRRGAAALPSLVHLGRRPQRQSRWAAATPAEPPGGAGGTGGAGCRPGRCRRRSSPGVRIAPGPRWERRGLRAPGAPRRPATPRRLITFALGSGGVRGGLLRVALSRSPSGEGKFLPVDFLFRNAKDQ